MTKILITGGAGYIGSHLTTELLKNGYEIRVFDNFSGDGGLQNEIMKITETIYGDILDLDLLQKSMVGVDLVIHLAAKKSISESAINPELYFNINLNGTINVINAMRTQGVRKIIYASSAAVYGDCGDTSITEEHNLKPTSVYGMTKLISEELLTFFSKFDGYSQIIFRYFNVIGSASNELRDRSKFNLVPIIIDATLKDKNIEIYGTDYFTKDGTCVRDYIHISDLVNAHLIAIDKIMKNNSFSTYNLGSGIGHSVIDVIKILEEISGKKIKHSNSTKRVGDSATLVSSINKIKREFEWLPQYKIMESITSDWNSTF
jgi:UDP-glucose 4-epimerase